MGLIWWKHKWCRLMLHLQKCHLHHHSSQGTSRAHRKRPWISVTTTNLPFARCQKLAQHQLLPHHQWRHLQRGRRLQHGRHLSVPLPGNPTTSRKKTTRLGVLRTTSKRKQEKDAKTTKKGKRSRAPSATKKTTARVASVRIPKKQRKEKKETEDDVKPEDITMTETPLKQLFHWPEQMAKVFSTDCCDAQKKPVHVQLWTEFSGAGTPEFALKALASQVPEHLSMQVMSQCDWSPTAQTCCINNSDKDTHLFSDIADIMSEERKARAERRVAVEVAWFYFHMWCVVFFFSLHLYIYIYCMIFLALWDIKYFDATKT